jgi:D-alanyl-D-alanine carboxypeptidase
MPRPAAITALWALACCAPQPTPSARWSEADAALVARLQTALEAARAEQDLPGLAAAVAWKEQRKLWVGATGLARLEPQTTWASGDEFRVGSATKMLTAAITMQLAQEGRLSLDDAIERWVPGWYAGPTLKNLLAHRSGIASYNYVGGFDESQPWTPQQLVQWAFDHAPALAFAPGTQFEYSNTNYVLLGMVIEKVTGQSYAEALRVRLFEPLQLGLRLAGSGDVGTRMVHCYTGAPPVDTTTRFDPSFGWAAGGVAATPTELARWLVALYGGELLPQASLDAMTTPSGPTPANQEDYGLGTFIQHDDGHTLVGHPGGIGGYQTWAYFLEPEGVAVVLMSNRDPTVWPQATAHVLAVLLQP